MADPKKMSVAEIIAAARKADSKKQEAGDATSPPAPTPAAPEASAEAAAPEPVASAESTAVEQSGPTPLPKDPKKMSVAEILAAARAEKAKAAAAPAKAESPAGKPAAKPAPAAAAASKPAPAAKATPAQSAAASGEKDTASILAAARKAAKPGPVSKADVAADKEKAPPAKKKLEVPPMPEKPAYARPRPAAAAAAQARTDRRGFLAIFFGSSLAVGFTSLAVTHVLWLLGLARFMFPNVLIEPPTRFKVGFPADFGPGQVSEKFKAQFGVWIVRYEYEGQPMIYALKTVCTHLGCTPNWLEGEQKFKCPCHGSGFYKDGINFEGPAPRPLERYAIRIADDGQLEVDKSATFNEETGQWADPASFVPV